MEFYKRREFIKLTATAMGGLSIIHAPTGLSSPLNIVPDGRRIGIIGLDTSHSVAFTKIFNDPEAAADLEGFQVVAAYPKGSRDIKTSVERVPAFTEEIKKLRVKVVNSIEELLRMVDVVMLETNDGRVHLEQAVPVIKAGKRVFIDKPLAASLKDCFAIAGLARQNSVPIFSSSSLRYFENAGDIEKVGKVTGADTFSPATLEKTHSDLYWYGIHGIELLYMALGPGCISVQRTFTDDTDIVVGRWKDNRMGTFRGIRSGKKEYGGVIFGENDVIPIRPGKDYGYRSLMVKTAQFFKTGTPPVPLEETLEIYTFMTAAEESSKNGGSAVELEKVRQKVKTK